MHAHGIDGPERLVGQPARAELPAQIALVAGGPIDECAIDVLAARRPVGDRIGRAKVGLVMQIDHEVGLAVGVAVDAFVVRMTFVPAVLTLLGRWAWWLPAGLERMLPEVDVEGAALHRKVAYEEWEADAGPTAVYAQALVASPGAPPLDVVAPIGTVTRVTVPEGIDERWLAQVLTGRARPVSGELVVGGLLLPEQRERVNRTATVIDLADPASEDELSWWCAAARDGVRWL